jgi:hypothetical protein
MKMSRTVLAAVTFWVLASLVASVQVDGSWGDRFLDRSQHEDGEAKQWGGVSSWVNPRGAIGADIKYYQASLMALFGKPTKDDAKPGDPGELVDDSIGLSGKLLDVPSDKQQMYFRPVSTTLKCVMMLTITSLLVYTVLSISRNSDELAGAFRPSLATETLTMGSRVGNFAPMMCMLFVSCRMYVLATTKGLGEPPAWVKSCMWLAVSGVGLQLFVVLILPQFTKKAAHDEAEYDMTIGKEDEVKAGKEHAKEHKSEGAAPLADQTNATDEADAELASRPVVDATGEQNDTHPDLNNVEYEKGKGFMKIPFWTLQAASIVMIYAGVGGVIVGIATFPSQHTKISAAVLCTVCMSCLYFFSTFFLWAARAASDNEDSALTNAALAMSSVVRKAPMFAVMFLASRMRALQLDPPLGMPPFWMQCLFYTITSMIYVESIIAAIVGAVGTHRKSYYGIYVFKSEGKTLGCTQHMLGIISYFILIPIFYGVYSMKFADGSEAPLSTTLKCTIILEIAYFGVMLWQSLVLLVEQATAADWEINRNASAAAGISLGLSPLLCILFVATRMRALQITQQKGAPPGWAQDCMNIAVFACCVQAICCLLMPIFVGSACKVDDDGNPDYDLEPMVGAYAVAVLKYVMLFALHGSVITVCASVYLMTPETAHSGDRFIGSTKSLFKMMAITLVVFCISLLFSSAKVVGMAIKFAIEAADQAFLGVDIEVKKVALNAFKGYVHIKDLVVCQPKD